MKSVGRFHLLEAHPARGVAPRGTLLLIHAFPLSAEMWRPQLALADSGWHVVAPHLRGFGGVKSPASSGTIDEYASDLVDLMDTLRVGQAAVAGLSLGGYVAFALYRRAGNRVRALVLADTRAEADTPEGVENRRKMRQLLDEQGPSAVADQMIPKLLAPATATTMPSTVAAVRRMILSNESAGIAGSIAAMMTRPDSTALLASITCPTLVVVGEHDALTPPPLSEKIQQGIPGAERLVIAGAGHLSNLEQPVAFNAALIGFLARV